MRKYLNERKKWEVEVKPGEVEDLEARVELFMLPAHLLWAVWAVIQVNMSHSDSAVATDHIFFQAENSTIDFDFADYALQRLSEFRRWKALIEKEAKL